MVLNQYDKWLRKDMKKKELVCREYLSWKTIQGISGKRKKIKRWFTLVVLYIHYCVLKKEEPFFWYVNLYDEQEYQRKLMTDQMTEVSKTIERNTRAEGNTLYLACMANIIKDSQTRAFLEYHNIYEGKEVVVVGAGPTLNYYEPIPNAIHIGVNGTYKKVNLDYLFLQDFDGEGEGKAYSIEEIKLLTCKKFVGRYIKKAYLDSAYVPEFVEKYIGASTYYVYDYLPDSDYDNCFIDYNMPTNICFFPLVDNASTIFSALCFALWTHPSKIYLVGCDCSFSKGQRFDQSKGRYGDISLVYRNWEKMIYHIKLFYRDVEIVSINPVGLKKLLPYINTESYTNEIQKE